MNLTANSLNACFNETFAEFPSTPFDPQVLPAVNVVAAFLILVILINLISVVCDISFVPAVENCAKVLNLSEDVAGATFLAAGSSAAEFFTNMIGAIVGNFNVGLATVVGSGVFNVVAVIGICGFFAGEISLNSWPLLRDSIVYSLALAVIFAVILDGIIYNYEAIMLICFYAANIILLKYNKKIAELYHKNIDDGMSLPVIKNGENFYIPLNGKADENQFTYKLSFYDISNLAIVKHHYKFSKKTVFRSSAHCVILEKKKLVQFRPTMRKKLRTFLKTIPSPTGKHFLVALAISIIWLAGLSYLVFWMVKVIGFSLQINSSIMGLAVLAIGSSIQDAFSSLKVAKEVRRYK
ncbi:solute carrier family 24 (sodium/potassium/calcium exchanger) member 3-like isoform CRA_b [Dinothrombium tinctorium]|uniref:Solute carrier family 24 (Sodium/potassium/calcium exchanger) member 3-like isoform CRA_b n=1 Tax=Dinothrombium tinctorium TaxID=1965070 RepID=A0A3S3QEU9_9ACAR|nr:solute carrier family 24 (sodium/potassium/calcium exchanger) member 3-like isoform CRA_b [Dinothrombium tinctorium]RWS06445.1 solute carrier family 24 (sodium/potassium/calcium exchanger) member 3-like isoform CRA_b [Dinothrombium tinctorium]RWS07964.1 solute carrier family 24 (sodium/potassium/calcium exchanger) member 3-like isoform CRA_b [Dinothrombium tinctorium]